MACAILKRGAGAGAEEALGFGDVMLGGVLGLILGWPAIFASLLLTILLSGAASLLYLLVMILARRYSPALSIPYGPYLVLGAVLLQVLQNLVNLLGIPSSLNFAVMGAVILLGAILDQVLAARRQRRGTSVPLSVSSSAGRVRGDIGAAE